MSSDRKKIGSISVVIDNDDGMEQIGDVSGGFSVDALETYLQGEGEAGFQKICEALIYMGAAARDAWHRVRDAREPKSYEVAGR